MTPDRARPSTAGRPPVASRLLVGALVMVVLAGCQTTPPAVTTGASTGSPATQPAPPATGTPASAPPATAALAATDLSGVLGELPDGRYTRRGFVPRITFEVDGPWRAVQQLEGFFDIQQQVGSPDVIAVQFARPTGVVGAGGAVVAPATAEAAIAAVRLNDAITVLDSSESLMDGHAGFVIEVENPASAKGDVAVLRVPPGPLGISPARRLWMAFLDTPDGLLAVLVGGSVANWDEALLTAEPVLETVTIGR